MNTNTDKMESAFSGRKLENDEYVCEADGLVYCSKCHTPRQCRKHIGNREFTPFVMCRCQKEDYDAEKAARAHREFLDNVSRMKASGLQDKELYACTFANDKGYNPEIRHAHTYVEKWDEMRARSTGLLLWGDVGTGKSFFAGCIANALLEKGVPVLMTNFARILNTLTGMHFDDRNQFIDSLNRYSLLIIDDLGAERDSEFSKEQVFNVIDSRYRSRKPLIVTTNLMLSEMKNTGDIARKRIYDRILERCVPVRINNQNIREQIASESMKQAKNLFSYSQSRQR
ncbi:MAG: ATP-binding protein [Clostridiales bacterium]|nr:ATP-binding protein [Clostridiales bacterium]